MSSIVEFSDVEELFEEDFVEISKDDSNEIQSEETCAFFTSKLRVSRVVFTTVPVEYPDTSSEGVATVYNITGWKDYTDAFTDIQYSINGSGGATHIQNCPFFGEISVKKNDRKCQGIKYCQFTDPELINQEHCSVDFDSEFFQNYKRQGLQDNDNKEAKTYALYLATKNNVCSFKKNNTPCNGGPRIGKITDYQTNIVSYFIGCNNFQQGEKWHRFIKIKREEIDISLLQSLFMGTASVKETAKCSMIVPKGCKRKTCDMPHSNNNTIIRGEIIQKSCPVRFIKIVPDNIIDCPFVALVCIGVHNHPPPAPERIPSGVKSNLQSLIEQAIHEDNVVTSRSLLSGNLIKAYFNKEALSEIHVSLNNIDRLRYLIGKAYKTLHPFGQGIMGIYHNISNANSDLKNYVRKIDLYNDNQVIIVCMLDEQAKKLITLEWFQIDVSFKRVKGEINEFEINIYDSDYHLTEGYHRLFLSLFQVIHEVSGHPVQFQHIHGQGIGCILADLDPAQAKGLGLALHDLDRNRDWESHLTFIFKSCLIHFERNLRNKPFSINTKNLIKQIPEAANKEQIYDLLQKINETKDQGIEDWLTYYQQPYILASLNQYISNIDHEIWRKSGINTNNAEAAHAMANREGKQLGLLSAIMRGKRYDERCYKTIDVHNKSGVPHTHQDRSEIKRLQRAITRKSSNVQKRNTNSTNAPKKRKINKSKISVQEESSENETELPKKVHQKQNDELLKLEIEERKLALKERSIKARAAEAEARMLEAKAEELELENIRRKKQYE